CNEIVSAVPRLQLISRPTGGDVDRSGDIRAAALELFTTRGYGATTMADIGEAVGMRGPSLYKHVPSKQDLLARIMVATMDHLLVAPQVAISTTTDPVERLPR